MPGLPEPVRQRIAAAAAGWPGASDASTFIEAVVVQRAQPLGEMATGDPDDTHELVASHVLRLVGYAVGGEAGVARAAGELAEDAALLAAFFQNLDLLPPAPDPRADGIALMVGAAIQRLADMLDPGPDEI